jgi:gamma-glutamylcysteine synthetase
MMPTLSLKAVVFSVLIMLTGFFGWYSYHLTGQLASVQAENVMLLDKNKEAVAKELLAKESCKVTTEVTAGVQKENDKLSESRTAILEALVNVAYPMTQENVYEAPQTTTEAPKKYVDNDRLSPELMRLLDGAYCSGNKDDSACTSK